MMTEMATTESSDNSAATTTAPKQEDITEAVNHLVQGKRHMLVQDYVSAVSSLEKACKRFAEFYGETANECGEPYLYYGKALLELSRMETGVLGHALQGVESEEDEDEEAENEDKDSKDSDDQVENPDNVTGDESGEERDLIVKQVGEALLENACELEKKLAEIKGEKSDSLEANGPTSKLTTKEGTVLVDVVSTSDDKPDSTEIKDIPTEAKEVPEDLMEAESSCKDDDQPKVSHSKDEVKVDEIPEIPKSLGDTDLKTEEKSEVLHSKDETETKMVEVSQSDSEKTEKEVSKDTAEKTGKDVTMDEKTDFEKDSTEKAEKESAKDSTEKTDIEKDSIEKADQGLAKDSTEKTDVEKDTTEKTDLAEKSEDVSSEKTDKEVAKDTTENNVVEKIEDASKDSTEKTENSLAKDSAEKMEVSKDFEDKVDDSESSVVDEKTEEELLRDIEVEKKTEKTEDVPKPIADVKKTTETTIPKDKNDAKPEFKVPSGDSITESSKKEEDSKPANEAESQKDKFDAKENVSETKMETDDEVPKEKSSSEIVPADSTQSTDKPSEIKTKVKATGEEIVAEEPMETDLESKTQDEDKDENEDGDESESIDEKSQDEEATAEDAEAGPSNSTEAAKEKEDEVTNLQLAWEVLELAKVIFDRQAEKEDKFKLKSAEVLLKLGEVSIESENYTQAIEDLNSCLDIQKKILTTDDRTIAETYYQLGLAFSLDNQFDNSVDHFTNAIRVLEERIAICRQVIERGKPEPKEGTVDGETMLEDPLETAKRELEELEALIPDIKTKIEDTEDMKKSTTEAMKEEALARLQKENSSGDTGAVSNSPQASPSKPTKDVSHLVKRKRKPEDDVVGDSKEEIKKVKSDNEGAGEQITNGNALNGEQKMEVAVEVEAS